MKPHFPAALLVLSLGVTAHADDAADIDAARRFATPMLGKPCLFTENTAGDLADANHVYRLKYRYPGQGQDEPDNTLTLVQLLCSAGAYNSTSVYITKDPASGEFRLLSFAEPKLDYDYTDESFTTLTGPPRVVGYRTRVELINSSYDPATMSISATVKWRSQGDAWSSGVWSFTEGEFVLNHYDVDPTYDLASDGSNKTDPAPDQSYQIYPEVKLMTRIR
ncbi:MAG: hypothetical protein JWM58_965 [Rhizobium sp.]|nr:hypothetical protein [Rhizobium sp.]